MLLECDHTIKEEYLTIQRFEAAVAKGPHSQQFKSLATNLKDSRMKQICMYILVPIPSPNCFLPVTLQQPVVFCQQSGNSICLITPPGNAYSRYLLSHTLTPLTPLCTFTLRSPHPHSLSHFPGHRFFMKTLYSMSSMADYALLVVAVSEGEYEAGISKSGQTRNHILFAYAMGLPKYSSLRPLLNKGTTYCLLLTRLVVAINKLDDARFSTWKNYPKSRYDEIKTEILKYTQKVGYKPENITFVPLSALCGNFSSSGNF